MSKPSSLEKKKSSQPRNDADQIHMRVNYVTGQSLNSSRRMKALCEEANEAGIKILGELDNQGEQLDNIEKGMWDVHKDMVQAEESLRGIHGYLRALPLPCLKKKQSAAFKANEDGIKGEGDRRPQLSNEGVPTYGGFISRYTNTAQEEEMDKNLEQVSILVGKLHKMANDIGSETGNQNYQLDHLNYQADGNLDLVDKANAHTYNLLK